MFSSTVLRFYIRCWLYFHEFPFFLERGTDCRTAELFLHEADPRLFLYTSHLRLNVNTLGRGAFIKERQIVIPSLRLACLPSAIFLSITFSVGECAGLVYFPNALSLNTVTMYIHSQLYL